MVADVYADILFIVNFIMNYIVFCIALKIMRIKMRWLRTAAASAISAIIYTVAIFIVPYNVVTNIISAMIILLFGVSVIYWPFNKNILQFSYFILTVWASAFLLAGAAFGLHYLISSPYSLIAFGIASEHNTTFSIILLIISSVGVYILLKIILSRFQKAHIYKQKLYDYSIWLNNTKTEIRGLVDTGNCLSEPISQTPVVVAEAAGLKNILPFNINLLFTNKQENEMKVIVDEFTKSGMSSKIRFIPYKSANGIASIFIGFRPDKIEIDTNDGKLTVDNVIIGICNFKLSPNGDYNSLLNPALFN